jgi:hypothetical protein
LAQQLSGIAACGPPLQLLVLLLLLVPVFGAAVCVAGLTDVFVFNFVCLLPGLGADACRRPENTALGGV